jgi:hypothetical protein
VRYTANTIEDMKKLLLGYRGNMRVEVETDVAVTATTVADLRALPTWPDGLVLNNCPVCAWLGHLSDNIA